MRWRQILEAAALTTALVVIAETDPAEAQKKISVLTWNIPVYKEKIDGWIADFKQLHTDWVGSLPTSSMCRAHSGSSTRPTAAWST